MAVAKENITELEKQFRRITVCSLCEKKFTNPKILPCFHSFCLNCLKENTTRNLQSGTTPNCLTCRIDFEIPKQGVAAIPTNEYLERIIATADALSSTIQIASFASDKMQRMRYCQKHMRKFDNYCKKCTRVICELCTKTEHRTHPVVNIAVAMNDLRQMIDSYFNGVISCLAYNRAQNNLCETEREGRTAAANVNQMYRSRARPDSRATLKAGRYYAKIRSPSPSSSKSRDTVKRSETSTSLDSWKDYVERFYEEISTRGWCIVLRSHICKIAKELNRFHDTWRNSYKQKSLAQQAQNSNALCARNNASIGDLDKRRELEEKEQCIQKLLREHREWMAIEKRLNDIIKRQSKEIILIEANLKEQELEYKELKMERDWFAGELQIAKAKSKPSITDKLGLLKKKISPTNKVGLSQNKQTLNGVSVIPKLYFVKEQQKLLDQIKEMEEYYIREKVIWDEKEEQLMGEIKRLENKTYAIYKQQEKSESQLFENLKEKIEWMQEKELCSDWTKQLKLDKEKLETELKEQQESNADIQKRQLQNEKRQDRKLEQLISWIERIDTQRAEFQTLTRSYSENGIIEKIKVSIINKAKELSENEGLMMNLNVELNYQLEELKSRASSEQMTQQMKSSSIAMKEHDWSLREKQYDDIIVKLKDKLTVHLQSEKRLGRELEQLISWIEQIDRLAELQMTTERHSENSIIEKLRVSVVKKAKELSENERVLINRNEELNHQMAEMKSRDSSELMALQLKSSNVAKDQHTSLIREKQDVDKIHELESQIDHLKENLTQQHELNKTTQGQLEAALRMESHLTAEMTDLRQRLGQCMADKKQEDDIGLLRDLENLIKWIERGDIQPTEGQVTTEEELENSIIKKIKALIIETTKELKNKEKQLLHTIEESGQQIAELRQRLATEEANQRKLDKELVSERDKLMQDIQLLKNGEKQHNARVQELESHIHLLKDALTQQNESNNNVKEQLKVALMKLGDETSLKQRLEHELSHQVKSSDVAEKERASLVREKQDADKIQKLESQIDQLNGDLKQQRESNRTTQGQLEATLRRESHLTAELTDSKQRLGQCLADRKQEYDTGVLQELKNLIKWIERGNRQPTEDQVTTEGESENSIIKKIKASIIKTRKELRDKEKQLLQANGESGQQIAELRQRLANEEANQRKLDKQVASERDKLTENVQLLKNDKKQLNAKVQELESHIHDLQDALTQQKECNNNVKEQLKTALIKNEDYTSLKQRLEHSVTYKNELSLIQLELEHLIQWIDSIDKQSTDKKTIEEKLQNHAVQKLKVSIKKKTNELKATEKLLSNRISDLEHQVTELQQNLAMQHQMHQTALRNSDAGLLKQLKEKDRILEVQVKQHYDEIHDLQNEILKLREVLRQQEVQYLADKKQEDDTPLLRELQNLMKWMDRGDIQPTEDQMTVEGKSENSIIWKMKTSIIKTTKDLRDKEKQLLQTIEESCRQISELKQILINEENNHQKLGIEFASERDKLAENVQLLKNGEKQLNARVQELESHIQDLQVALTQQKECTNKVEEQLKAALIKHGDETSLKQRLEHKLSLTQLELEHLIQWIDTIDKQSTYTKTMEKKSQNDAIQKLKVSVKNKTNELKATEKQLLKRINILEHQVAELQQSLTSEQQMCQTAIRNSDASLHKQSENDRIHDARIKRYKDEIHDLQNEILKLREVLRQQEEQNRSSRKELGQVATKEATLITDITDLKQLQLNTMSTFDDSTAVHIAESGKPTLPTGISNVGNTCYFGATMQNLVYTFLLSEELHLSLSKQSPTDVEQLLTNAYIEFIQKYYEANCDETFRHMYNAFCRKSSRFADRGQHDSHDLFVNFLNCLRDEERRRFGSANSPGFRNVLTVVDKVFGGHTITVYVCSTCKTPYHVCEPFLDISVPILGPKDGGEDEEEDLFNNHLHNPQSIGDHDSVRQAVEATMRPLGDRSRFKTPLKIFEKRSLMPESMGEISLKQCLVYYSRTERIHNEYLCNPCEAKGRPAMTSALKRTLIYNPPAVLVLHLKRFEQTTVGFKKCNQRVTYDEYLDIGHYCSSSCLRMREPDDANIWYSLYGVVVHKGSLTSGHYISYIKDIDCDTRQSKQFMQQTFLNRDQVLNGDEIRRINASRGMVRSRKEWEPKEVEGQWYLADDDYVKVVEKTEALSQAAYLLFYERVAK